MIGSKSARKMDVHTSGANARCGEVALVAVAFTARLNSSRKKCCFPRHAGAGEGNRPSAAKAEFIAKHLRTT
jgi:hypothetical protein